MTDPRIRQLAQHRQRIGHEAYGSTANWNNLKSDEQQLFLQEAAAWLNAAVEAGIASPTDSDATTEPALDTELVRAALEVLRAVRRAHSLGWRTVTVRRLIRVAAGDTRATPPDPATAPPSAFSTYRPHN